MKSFIEIITEAKDRFIRKSKVLSKDEQDAVIKWIEKYKNFEDIINKEIGWNKVHKVSFDTLTDYLAIATDTKSAKKKQAKKLRHKGIKGLKEGEDYINVKTKNPYYLTYIPLHYGAAQVIKTSHIGGCTHDGCIGSTQASLYFKQEGKKKGRVAVYVIGMGEKYVVMMYPDGRHETWRKENERGESGEIIPNFSIKKELATSKLKELYKDILSNKSSGTFTYEEYDAAVKSYEEMASDIERWANNRREAEDEYWNEMRRTIDNTIESYQDLADEAEQNANDNVGDTAQRKRLRDRVLSFEGILKSEPRGTGTDPKTGEPVWHIRGTEPTKRRQRTSDFKREYIKGYPSEINREGIPYTRSELQAFIDLYYDEYEDKEFEEPDFDERDEYLEIVDRLKDIDSPSDVLDSSDYDDIEWTDDGIYEYEEYDLYPPDPMNRYYDDYFEFYQDYEDPDYDDIDRRDSYEYIWEVEYYQGVDGLEELENLDLPHPEKIASNLGN